MAVKKNSQPLNRHKSQSAVEITFIVAIMFMMLASLVVVYFDREETTRDIRETLEMKRAAFEAARRFNSVVESGNGTNATFQWKKPHAASLPGRDYCIEVNYRKLSGVTPTITVYVSIAGDPESQAKSASAPVLTRNARQIRSCNANTVFTFVNMNGYIDVQT